MQWLGGDTLEPAQTSNNDDERAKASWESEQTKKLAFGKSSFQLMGKHPKKETLKNQAANVATVCYPQEIKIFSKA